MSSCMYNILLYFYSFIFVTVTFIGGRLFTIYRYIISFYISSKYNIDAVEFVDGVDAVFCLDSEKTPYVGQTWKIVKGKAPDIKQFRERVYKEWLQPKNPDGSWKFQKYRKALKYCLGYYFWIDRKNVQIEDHVTEYDASGIKTKEEIHQLAADLAPLPIHQGILWRHTLINFSNGYPGLDSGPYFVLYFNAHHVLYDAIVGTRMDQRLTDTQIDDTEFFRKRATKTSRLTKFLYWTKVVLWGPYMFSKSMRNKKECVTFSKDLTGGRLVSFADPIPLDKVKMLKNRTGTTVNDVLTSFVVSAIKKYLLSRGLSTDMPVKLNIPISLHEGKSDLVLENKVSFLSLLVDLKDESAIGFLKTTQRGMDELKTSVEMHIVHFIGKYCVNRIPRWIIMRFSRNFLTTAIVTNSPTPNSGKIFGGEFQQVYLMGMPNSNTGCAVTISFMSDCKGVNFGVVVDRSAMKSQKELDEFCGYIVDAFNDLCEYCE